MNRKDFEILIKGKFTPEENGKIMLAYRFSKYGHRNQFRKDGRRYFEHPREVARILMEELEIFDYELIVAILLHDLKEDSYLLIDNDIELIFGNNIYLLVEGMTKEKNENKEKYLKNIFSGKLPNINIVLLIKLKILKIADRIHNLRDAINTKVWTPEKLKEYKEHARKYMLEDAYKINATLGEKLEELL